MDVKLRTRGRRQDAKQRSPTRSGAVRRNGLRLKALAESKPGQFFSDLRELQQQESTAEALREHSVAPEPGAQQPRTDQADGTPISAASSTAAVVTPRPSSAEYIVGEIRRHKRGVAIAVVIVLLATVGIAYGLIELWRRSQTRPPAPSQSMKIRRLTDTGNATAAAISPDGNYVAYASRNTGSKACV